MNNHSALHRWPAAAGFALSLLAHACAFAQTPPDSATLERVEVIGTRSPLPGIAESALRSPVPIEKTPQSVVVISRKLIEDQDARTLTEVMNNVSAVRGVDPRDLANGGFRIRGFAAGIMVDGVALPGFFTTPESMAGVNFIEVVKGPVGTLYGGAQLAGSGGFAGGLIALTTALPSAKASASVGVRMGNSGDRGLSFDLNQPLDASVAVRLAGDIGRIDSETDLVTHRHTTLQPSLAWRPTNDSLFVVRLRHGKNAGRDYSGLPAQGTVLPAPYTIPRERILTANGLPDSTSETDMLNLQWTQRLNDTWTWSITAAQVSAEVDQRGTFPFPFPAGAGPLYVLAGARLQDRFDSTVVSPSLTGRFTAAGAEHTLVTGLDVDRTRDDAFLRFSPGLGALGFIDVTAPAYPDWAEPDTTGTPDQRNLYKSQAVYVQDMADFGGAQLMAGLRHTRAEIEDVNPAFFVNNDTSHRKTLGRLGGVVALGPKLSAFAGWGQGMRVPTFAVFTTPPRPELSTQREIGLRLTNLGGLSATLAWFDLSLKNALASDPVNIGQTIQVGRQQSKGYDLDLNWQMTPGWSWIGSFSKQDPKIEDTGKQTFNVPKKSARLATRYEFGSDSVWSGLGIGLGATLQGERPADAANTFFTPQVTVFDLQVAHRSPRTSVGVSVSNLSDKQYFQPSLYFGGGHVTPGARRQVSATARINF
jgi:iron complex outermembrane recepter protein